MLEHQKLLCVFGEAVAVSKAALPYPASFTTGLTPEAILAKDPSVR
jgi:hypothetical protein